MAATFHQIEHKLVAAAELFSGIHDEQQQIAALEGGMHLLHHLAIERTRRLVHAGGIHKHDLPGGPAFLSRYIHDSLNIVASGLRLVGDNGDFFADQSVQQGGFARIGASDDGNKPGAKGHSAQALICWRCCGVVMMRKRTMRRAGDSSTSKRKSSRSTTSPRLGMRPSASLTKPATVVASWASGRMLNSSCNRSTSMLPGSTLELSLSRMISALGSCWSRISTRISSTKSFMVPTPA